ncbi:putative DNA binding domain-containing protein [soil metagenome]
MKTKSISEADVLRLSMRAEDHFFDRKALAVSGGKVQKIAVAFANTDGGDFAVGIADDDDEPDPAKRWQGAKMIEDFNSHLQAINEITPALPYDFTIMTCDSRPGYVLLVNVEKSSQVHHTADKTVYVRLGAQSLPLKDPQKIVELGFAKGSTTYEDQTLPEANAEDVAETPELKLFLQDFAPRSDPLEYVINENLIDRRSWKPRAAGVVLFNPNPSAIIPRRCAVRIARYETREDDPERDHLKETISIEGPLYHQIHKSVETIAGIMSSVKIWTTIGLRTVSYPPEAIWEIVANAIIHRDYSISDDIQILIFNNRIEVQSPGKLPGYVTIENILDARYSRNSKIVRTLARYKDPPNRDLGEGLNTAFQKMTDWKLRAPEISVQGNYVKVVIPHTPLAKPTEAILEFLKSNDRITNRQAREITGIKSENLVKIEFYKLRDEVLLEMIPDLKGSAAAWRLTGKGKQHVAQLGTG